jgi:hypothetical protein
MRTVFIPYVTRPDPFFPADAPPAVVWGPLADPDPASLAALSPEERALWPGPWWRHLGAIEDRSAHATIPFAFNVPSYPDALLGPGSEQLLKQHQYVELTVPVSLQQSAFGTFTYLVDVSGNPEHGFGAFVTLSGNGSSGAVSETASFARLVNLVQSPSAAAGPSTPQRSGPASDGSSRTISAFSTFAKCRLMRVAAPTAALAQLQDLTGELVATAVVACVGALLGHAMAAQVCKREAGASEPSIARAEQLMKEAPLSSAEATAAVELASTLALRALREVPYEGDARLIDFYHVWCNARQREALSSQRLEANEHAALVLGQLLQVCDAPDLCPVSLSLSSPASGAHTGSAVQDARRPRER